MREFWESVKFWVAKEGAGVAAATAVFVIVAAVGVYKLAVWAFGG